MASVEQTCNHIDFIPGDHDMEAHENDKKSYRSSFSSSSRPSTPATPASEIDDLEVSPKTIVGKMLGQDIKSDNLLVPALPAKSSLRASRLLATLPQKNSSEARPVLTPAAPHLLYLSSEEDASSSADDFSDCDYASDNEPMEETPEQPARMVSVVFSGRPSIIELPRRSISPSSTECTVSELLRTSTEPSLNRKGSYSSDLSMAYNHPPRSSSMINTTFDMQRHTFLNTDPFATKSELDEREVNQTRKATTMFKRTLSLVRKRSKPVLNSTGAMSRENLSIQPVRMQQVGEEQEEHHVSEPRTSTPRGPATYHEIISSARKNSYSATSSPVSETTSPTSPGKKLRSGFMSRRKSIKA
ncbi:hypothetical protein PT974_06819 [Cladobotryum mycophilum]|uniref:Uncharacterized protein n=1 Tax=Cladobotryum mycophilum TaxID=491253 RepID=A0ABR0SMQ0_9HYPO